MIQTNLFYGNHLLSRQIESSTDCSFELIACHLCGVALSIFKTVLVNCKIHFLPPSHQDDQSKILKARDGKQKDQQVGGVLQNKRLQSTYSAVLKKKS